MKQIEIEIDGIIYKTFVRDNEEISLTVEETHYDDEFMDGHGFGFNDRHRRNQREEYEVFPPITGKVVGIIPVGTKIKKGDVLATIEAMKLRHAEKRQYDRSLDQAEAIAEGEAVDWQKVLEEWNEYYKNNPE